MIVTEPDGILGYALKNGKYKSDDWEIYELLQMMRGKFSNPERCGTCPPWCIVRVATSSREIDGENYLNGRFCFPCGWWVDLIQLIPTL